MYNQLFFTLPVFITQWVNTSNMYDFFMEYAPFFAENYGSHGQMEAEFIVNFDAMFIIIFQVLISSFVMRWKALNTMIRGFIISSIGMALTLMTQNVVFIIAALLIFSVGEMTASPKISEYIGRIAPSDKKALYMGYSFIPMFLGNVFAGFISGDVYQQMSDKHSIVRREVAQRGLEISEGLTQNQYFKSVAEALHMNEQQLTNYLWETYHPSNIWIIILSIGLVAALCLWLYNKYLIKIK